MTSKSKALNQNPQKWMPQFLKRLAETGHVGNAAKYAHVSRETAYNHKQANPDFAAQWEAALHVAVDTVMEPEAWRRAIDGVEKPIYQRGKLVGTEMQYSDTLLIFLLKANLPAKYRESIDLHIDLTKLTDDELALIARGKRP